ncbi:HAD-IIIA family hydrolase [Nitrosovibrio sp. Nv17]|jgi:D-glycero-D-manno-heptose 1,7-bisphosphate phosphatase|uniref:HAD-IIIA family hydrolase n=1 Tax=Nitrosovibrio sp. Nv17 TaxID=1855339 RepID=UPI0009087DEE|nr:HAD-IIIA family hydrolase [Nitrosovibrio sp. Nv17]SFW11027.1 D-alpha,beta-D-heptose 1,7-bisphosphate phosphatase [Nitrosovibrio sp. Nv17]
MKLAIVDRDGVIAHGIDTSLRAPDEWKPIPGGLDALARLGQAGYRIVVAAHQAGDTRKLPDMATLNAIHDRMWKAVGQAGGRIDAIFFHARAATSPRAEHASIAATLIEISQRFGVTLDGVPVISDSLRDLQAAAAAGAAPMLVLTGRGRKTRSEGDLPANTRVFRNLAAAVDALAS